MLTSVTEEQAEQYVKKYAPALKAIVLIYNELLAQKDPFGLAFLTQSLDAIIQHAHIAYDKELNKTPSAT